jgi:hypothetical protein
VGSPDCSSWRYQFGSVCVNDDALSRPNPPRGNLLLPTSVTEPNKLKFTIYFFASISLVRENRKMSQNPIEDAVDAILAATADNFRQALRVVIIENIRLHAELDAHCRVALRKDLS